MRVLLQRVNHASVLIDKKIEGEIDKGYVLLVGFEEDEDENYIEPIIGRILKLKLFSDADDRMSFTLDDVSGSVLIISQFTLFADLKKGTKPSFHKACNPQLASVLYHQFVQHFKSKVSSVQTGVFGASMQVNLENDGPVTILFDSKELFPKKIF